MRLKMEAEDVVSALETYGPYQRRLFLLLTIPLVLRGFQAMMVIVTFYTPPHRCKIPELPNDTFAIQGDFHQAMVNRSIPVETSGGEESYSQCQLYVQRNSTHNRTGSNDTEDCRAWVYDTSQFDLTIATQFDLVCDQKGFRANFNMFRMLGLLVGSPLSGVFCDRYGRKPVLTVCLLAATVMGVAAAFPVVPAVLHVWSFVLGALGVAMYLSLYVLTAEFVPISERSFSGSMMMLLWLIGPFLVAALSYVLTDWRYIQIISCAPLALCLGYWWLIPESPRWLLSKGRVKEARAVVMKVVQFNELSPPSGADCEWRLEPNDEGSWGGEVEEGAGEEAGEVEEGTGEKAGEVEEGTGEKAGEKAGEVEEGKGEKAGEKAGEKTGEKAGEKQEEGAKKGDKIKDDMKIGNWNEEQEKKGEEETEEEEPSEKFWTLLKYPNLVTRTGIIIFNWCVVAMTYFGLSLNVSNLAGSVRVNFLLSNAVELLGYSAAWLLLDRLGRKRLHCSAMLLAGTACLASIFTVTFRATESATTAMAMVGKLGISAAYSSIYLLSAELFPTVIRNFGMGCCSSVGRVGSAVSPYIADLSLYIEGSFGPALPLVIFGGMAMAAGLLSLFLPETLHRKLPDTVLEAANFTKEKATEPVTSDLPVPKKKR